MGVGTLFCTAVFLFWSILPLNIQLLVSERIPFPSKSLTRIGLIEKKSMGERVNPPFANIAIRPFSTPSGTTTIKESGASVTNSASILSKNQTVIGSKKFFPLTVTISPGAADSGEKLNISGGSRVTLKLVVTAPPSVVMVTTCSPSGTLVGTLNNKAWSAL